MKKASFLFCLCIAIFATYNTQAQYYFYNDDYYDNPVIVEAGASLNAMNSFTDIGGKKGAGGKFLKDLNFGNTTIGGGVFVSAMYKNAIAARLEGTFGRVQAYDSILTGVTDIAKERYNRNLHFRSTITELSLMAEIHPLFIFINYMESDRDVPRYSPYLLAGVGYFAFNPQAKLGNTWVDLQPLSTEGQGFNEFPDRPVYKLRQMNFPFGLGVKYELSPMINLRGEFVYRKLNTDYLDDVSTTYIDPELFAQYFSGTKLTQALLLNDRQKESRTNPEGGSKRGSSAENDSYFSFNVKVSLVLGRQKIR